MLKPQKQFPLLARYKEVFPVNEDTIFAYGEHIYCNHTELPRNLIIHEETHLKQQKEIGLDNWVNLFLSDSEFRLKQEVEAYRNQVQSIKDRNSRHRLRLICARDLSSPLYGGIININEAMQLLK